MIRVLIVEDSPTCCDLIRSALARDPALTVVGIASNGLEAVEMTSRLRPSVISMDIEMPVLNGVDATRRIMSETPTPIVVVSSRIHRSETSAAEALGAGALAVLEKLPEIGSAAYGAASKRLTDTLKSMSHVKLVRRWKSDSHPCPPHPLPRPLVRTGASAVIAMAASTGGPSALRQLLGALPAAFPAPILVVQHICDSFTAGFAKWLEGHSLLRVKLAEHGEPLNPATVYIAPDGRHLKANRAGAIRAHLSISPPVGRFRPSADVLFQSVAQAYGRSATGVILTGMGTDGLSGLQALRAAGGLVIAQDEATSVVFGMPGAVVAAGIADHVLPLNEIPRQLCSVLTNRFGDGEVDNACADLSP